MTSQPGPSGLRGVRDYWDDAADAFDGEPDHGLRDPAVRAAWATYLTRWLPESSADVLDVGCGTGSLSLLMAEAGHRVFGVDLAPRMVQAARAKCGRACSFAVGDAGDPPVGDARFDVVLARHLLWTLAEPAAALRRWIELLRAGGRLVLVEGRWESGADGSGDEEPYAEGADLPWAGGVGAEMLQAAVRPLVTAVTVQPLPDPLLWGRPVTDERYALIATR